MHRYRGLSESTSTTPYPSLTSTVLPTWYSSLSRVGMICNRPPVDTTVFFRYLDVIFFEPNKYHGPHVELKGFLDAHGDD